MQDALARVQEAVRAAAAAHTPLRLRGGGTKDFYGNAARGDVLDLRSHAGIVAYEPTELCISARAGTPLAELEQALAARGQCLPFEPPHFGAGATVGGCVASGLAGPRRAAAGAVRDFVLGVRIVDGRGRFLSFGGQVMKNVAGYDVSRLMTGALGTLGVVMEATFKVAPLPAAEESRALRLDMAQALDTMNRWAGRPLPVTGTAWIDGTLHVRLAGAAAAVRAAAAAVGGEAMSEHDARALWTAVREQTHPFFAGDAPLWRLAVRSTAPALALPGAQLIEWTGGQRWLRTQADARAVRAAAADAGGHATLFRAGEKRDGAFAPLAAPNLQLHRALKQAFDPAGILNPGRLYPEL